MNCWPCFYERDNYPGEMDVPRTGTQAASRVADVLLFFMGDEHRPGASAMSSGLGISKAVVHRILQSLVAGGWSWPTS